MPVQRPYYALHQVILGKYTPGGEYILDTGDDYIGMYHVLPNGQVFTESRPATTSVELYVKRIDLSEQAKVYNQIMGLKPSQYKSPMPIQPIVTLDDYTRGEIQRFFVQKRNNPSATIIEIDSDQYNSINVSNNPGINGVIWNKVLIPWKVSLMPKNDVAYLNSVEILKAEQLFPGIKNFLTDYLEFYR